MLLLGHLGITLGAATLLSEVTSRRTIPGTARAESSLNHRPITHLSSWFTRLGEALDIRLLLPGSMLPDIIDKPLGHLIFPETIANGRTFAHTLLFSILLVLAGLIIYRRSRRNWLLVIAAGTGAHLLLDGMWNTPVTLFWPLYGFSFPRGEVAGWLSHIWYILAHEPDVYIPEIVGGVILLLFLWVVLRSRSVKSVLAYGRLNR